MTPRGLHLVVIAALTISACSESRDLGAPCSDCTASVHPVGILDPASPDFHGKELARRNWSFATCATCHGQDFGGGTSKVSCLQCHQAGPTACVTCHGAGPTTGSHAQHRGAQVDCNECHTVPDRWDAPGHILDDPPPAEIVFGVRAALTPPGALRAGPPSFENGTCRNVYCHGATMTSAGGAQTEPRWTEPAPLGTCVRCHASPPPSHARSDCATCHPATAPHIDGVVQIGTTDGCSGCHGDSSSPAPPRDLAGNTFTTSIGVGAHRAHLNAPSGLRGPVPCDACHVVPATITAPGHIDSDLPAEVVATLGWDRAAETCSSAWCHGTSRPVWTHTGEVACGTCHGIPPSTPSHTPGMLLTSCAGCHPRTVTASGAIIVDGGQSAHMNGVIDAP